METLKELLAKNIRDGRHRKRMTQSELAEKCNLSLLSIQRAESGKVWPDYSTIEVISKGLSCSSQMLFSMPETPSPTIESLMEIIKRQESELQGPKLSPLKNLPSDIVEALSQMKDIDQIEALRAILEGFDLIKEEELGAKEAKKAL